jgi:hypothetical protein
MLLLEGTEPEKESMTVRLGLGSRTSRIDEIAHILTTAGSKGDGQPYSKAWLSGLTGERSGGGGVNSRKKRQRGVKGREGRRTRGGRALGAVYRGRIHSWETEPGNPV